MNKTKTIAAAIILSTAAILALNYVLFQILMERKLDLTSVCIAVRDIPPRARIKEDDLTEISVPASYLADHAYTRASEIIGKYTDIQGKIPAGSFFYHSMLYDASELPDSPATQLRSRQTAYTMQTDRSRLGSIIAGQRVDIHASIQDRNGTVITGCLIKGARVIAVRDHKGLDMDDPEGTGVPYTAELAVNTADVQLLTVAEAAGTIRLFATDRSYDSSAEAVLNDKSEIAEALRKLQNPPTPAPSPETVPLPQEG